MRSLCLGFLGSWLLFSCAHLPEEDPRSHLRDFLPQAYQLSQEQFEGTQVVAVASFPANDFDPGFGNGLVLFAKEGPGFERRSPTYPLKVAARPYQGFHTGFHKRFLETPVGVFGVHRGSRNGSRFVSWAPAVRQTMAKAQFVPAFGVKVPDQLKPQKHFTYAMHSVPIHYGQDDIRKRGFDSLGCWSLLVPHMREVYRLYKSFPTEERLLISIYDTFSVDVEKQMLYVYRDIYHRGVNTLENLQEEFQRSGIPFRRFSKAKMQKALEVKEGFRNAISLKTLF